MFSAMRRRVHVTPATVIAGLALVFAMTGGAYAAKKYLITSTKQVSPSVLKALQGKAGAAGAPGSAGAQGPAGPQGPAGANGSNGTNGEKGLQGEKGATGAAGKEGKTGATGATGFAGFTETLPAGKTEMGLWSAQGFTAPGEAQPFAISFTIPLAAPSAKVVHLSKSQTENSVASPVEGCEFEVGNPAAKPVAPESTLCVFTVEEVEGKIVAVDPEPGRVHDGQDSPAGAYLQARSSEEETGQWRLAGTWAVTAAK